LDTTGPEKVDVAIIYLHTKLELIYRVCVCSGAVR